jgi:NitT/TauT family transport system substrate-binding protein
LPGDQDAGVIRAHFLTAAALSLSSLKVAGAQSLAEIAIAGSPNDTAGLLYYAADMGFYEQAGLHVKLAQMNNSGSISAALASGALQFGSFALTLGALARDHGLALTLVAPAGLYLSTTPTSGLIVLKGSPAHAAADLNGKVIATRDLSNMSYYGAKRWLDANGGDSKSVRWLEVPDATALAALQAGRVDAASVSEPALEDALRSGAVRSLASVFDAIAKRFLISGYFTTDDFAKAHPDVVRQFANVMSTTAVWANKNRPRTAQILEKYIQTPVAPGSPRVTYADRLAVADVQPVLDLLYNYGLLKTPQHAKDLFSPLVPSR